MRMKGQHTDHACTFNLIRKKKRDEVTKINIFMITQKCY
jgi:hypothetical protein